MYKMALTNAEIAQKYRISPFGGINRSKLHGVYVLKINDNSVYDDYVYNHTIHYTGQGLKGNQTLTRNNKGLATLGLPCHVWWRVPGTKEYEMLGVYMVEDYFWDKQNDRRVIMFRLKRKPCNEKFYTFVKFLILLLVLFLYPISISHVYSGNLRYCAFGQCGHGGEALDQGA